MRELTGSMGVGGPVAERVRTSVPHQPVSSMRTNEPYDVRVPSTKSWLPSSGNSSILRVRSVRSENVFPGTDIVLFRRK